MQSFIGQTKRIREASRPSGQNIFFTHTKKKKRANKVLHSANWKPDGRKRGGKRFTLGRMVPDSEPMEIREEKRTEEDRTFFGSSNPPFSLSSSSGRLRKILHIHPIQAALETFFRGWQGRVYLSVNKVLHGVETRSSLGLKFPLFFLSSSPLCFPWQPKRSPTLANAIERSQMWDKSKRANHPPLASGRKVLRFQVLQPPNRLSVLTAILSAHKPAAIS